MNDNKYNNIDFSTFQCEPIEMSEAEKQRIRNRFVEKKKTKNKVFRYIGTVAAVACLGLCISVTALGGIDETFAAVKHLFMGTGEYLGVAEQDDYAHVIDETQTKGDYTITLNSAIASDREMRFSVTTETDGDKKAPYAWISKIWIDGKEIGKDIYSDGIGHFRSPKEEDLNKDLLKQRTCFPEITYDYEMPTNPKIKVVFSVGKEFFTYEFVLDNEKFQTATRTVEVNKTMNLDGMEVKIEKLEINPISQLLYVKTGEILNEDNNFSDISTVYNLEGTNNLGEKIGFQGFITAGYPNLPLECFLRDVDDEFYYPSSEGITWYELQWYNYETEAYMGEKFVIEVE